MLQTLSAGFEELGMSPDEFEESQRAKYHSCYLTMRSLVPPNIAESSLKAIRADGLPDDAAERIWHKKILWLVSMHPDDMLKIHIADLRGKYQFHGLDIVEMRAIWHVIPKAWQGDNPKADWRHAFKERLDSLVAKEMIGDLEDYEQRHPSYAQIEEENIQVYDPSAPLMKRFGDSCNNHVDLNTGSMESSDNVNERAQQKTPIQSTEFEASMPNSNSQNVTAAQREELKQPELETSIAIVKPRIRPQKRIEFKAPTPNITLSSASEDNDSVYGVSFRRGNNNTILKSNRDEFSDKDVDNFQESDFNAKQPSPSLVSSSIGLPPSITVKILGSTKRTNDVKMFDTLEEGSRESSTNSEVSDNVGTATYEDEVQEEELDDEEPSIVDEDYETDEEDVFTGRSIRPGSLTSRVPKGCDESLFCSIFTKGNLSSHNEGNAIKYDDENFEDEGDYDEGAHMDDAASDTRSSISITQSVVSSAIEKLQSATTEPMLNAFRFIFGGGNPIEELERHSDDEEENGNGDLGPHNSQITNRLEHSSSHGFASFPSSNDSVPVSIESSANQNSGSINGNTTLNHMEGENPYDEGRGSRRNSHSRMSISSNHLPSNQYSASYQHYSGDGFEGGNRKRVAFKDTNYHGPGLADEGSSDGTGGKQRWKDFWELQRKQREASNCLTVDEEEDELRIEMEIDSFEVPPDDGEGLTASKLAAFIASLKDTDMASYGGTKSKIDSDRDRETTDGTMDETHCSDVVFPIKNYKLNDSTISAQQDDDTHYHAHTLNSYSHDDHFSTEGDNGDLSESDTYSIGSGDKDIHNDNASSPLNSPLRRNVLRAHVVPSLNSTSHLHAEGEVRDFTLPPTFPTPSHEPPSTTSPPSSATSSVKKKTKQIVTENLLRERNIALELEAAITNEKSLFHSSSQKLDDGDGANVFDQLHKNKPDEEIRKVYEADKTKDRIGMVSEADDDQSIFVDDDDQENPIWKTNLGSFTDENKEKSTTSRRIDQHELHENGNEKASQDIHLNVLNDRAYHLQSPSKSNNASNLEDKFLVKDNKIGESTLDTFNGSVVESTVSNSSSNSSSGSNDSTGCNDTHDNVSIEDIILFGDPRKAKDLLDRGIKVISSASATSLLLRCAEDPDAVTAPLEALTLLVDTCKANVNAATENGTTALHLLFNKPLMGRFLISRGADFLMNDAAGECPLSLCLEYGYSDYIISFTFASNNSDEFLVSKSVEWLKRLAYIMISGGLGSKAAKLVDSQLVSISADEAMEIMESLQGQFDGMPEPVETYEILERLILQ